MRDRSQAHVSGESYAVVADHVLFEQLGENVVLLDVPAGQYYELNGVGSRMFTLIQQRRDLTQVLDVMLQEYLVDEDTLRAELRRFIDSLAAQGWLRTGDGAPS